MSGVNRLFVEGELDSILLNSLPLSGWQITPLKDGGKRALPLRVKWEQADNGGFRILYLRDRDFDFEPSGYPGPCRMDDDLGFRWSRHELENYMIDPLIVTRAVNLDVREYSKALTGAGNTIRHYQAARWAVGLVRSGLPRWYGLETHPNDADPSRFRLHADLSQVQSRAWALKLTTEFLKTVSDRLDANSVGEHYDRQDAFFAESAFMTTDNVLMWFSGKDLLAALGDWLMTKGHAGPGDFRSKIRDWMIRNPSELLHILPEWRQLVTILQEASQA